MNEHTRAKEGMMQPLNGSTPKSTTRTTALSLFSVALLAALPSSAHAERGNIPVLEQVTRNTVGNVADAELRSELGTWITFASNGDVMGPGTQTAGREVYLYNVIAGTTTRVTNSGPGRESYEPSRVSDSTFSAGRPDSFFFTSTGNFTGQNADGNPEIFVYEIVSGQFHQLTNTAAPVVNKTPFTSDSAKCIVFASTGNIDNNDGSDDSNVGPGYSNPDGSQEIFLYTVADNANFPSGYFTQISNGPAGTSSWAPVIGGYWFPRQCQTSAYLSDHAQLNDGALGTHIYEYDRPAGEVKRMFNEDVFVHGELPPDGFYGEPHISSASNFARGPYIVFSTSADVWNNGSTSTGYQMFRYRVFHPLMTQYSGVTLGDVFKPQISDGGGYIAFNSTSEILNDRGAKHIGPGPFNPDNNSEIFETKGRRKIWQITESSGCDNYDVSIQDHGGGLAFLSTCDLVPGSNPAGLPQVFLFRRVRSDDPVLQPGACSVLGGCCNEANGCYRQVFGKMDRPPKRNALE
jgi:hypothetical protein